MNSKMMEKQMKSAWKALASSTHIRDSLPRLAEFSAMERDIPICQASSLAMMASCIVSTFDNKAEISAKQTSLANHLIRP